MARPRDPAKADAILNAALKLFNRDGVAATRMEDIARAAGLATGTCYLYFRDKNDILAACARRFHEKHRASQARLRARPGPAGARLRDYVLERHRAWRRETRGATARTDFHLAMLQAAPGINRAETRLWREGVRALLAEGARDGEFAFADLDAELDIFLTSLVGCFPPPGARTAFHGGPARLRALLDWFRRKWSPR